MATELRRTHPPRSEKGFTVFFTGLSASGKSTLANVLRIKLLEAGDGLVTLLDGDLHALYEEELEAAGLLWPSPA